MSKAKAEELWDLIFDIPDEADGFGFDHGLFLMIRDEHYWAVLRVVEQVPTAWGAADKAEARGHFDDLVTRSITACTNPLWGHRHSQELIAVIPGSDLHYDHRWSVVWRLPARCQWEGFDDHFDAAQRAVELAEEHASTYPETSEGRLSATALLWRAAQLRSEIYSTAYGESLRRAASDGEVGRGRIEVSNQARNLGRSREFIHQVLRGQKWS
ncbi:hypothetical protein [Actinomadura litoris]|uniref:hypothetical protein n=1 Tax=Actinomadura litoris TaxID=2678616 RepID=UPI001FA7E834|nr:hypothetical protein [Actinomadura litoris]